MTAHAVQHLQTPVQGHEAASLPAVDWTRYHLQILFVDWTDTVRARVATGLFERIAEWNGYGRALYPWACGVQASEHSDDVSTTVALMTQATFLGIRTKLFAAPGEQLTPEDLDRYDVIVALDSRVQAAVMQLGGSAWQEYYSRKVCKLSDFSDYTGEDILAKGGSALLEPKLSMYIQQDLEAARSVIDIARPSLHKGAEEWNPMVKAMIVDCAGLVKYLADQYPSDLPHYDPQ